ncbi:MAG: hypothetical protein BJBARM5_0350 [Candidatus Parvarchaeum acidophilus ARMAN-5]|uniref:Uncharacterized protein n=2 Tax=Parvarchaeum acidophilus TaxID=662761 RepID=D6GV47_PARA5|nr:MAG: hypothetical protein BJBARM5_0350 [Candidatus Parvarchaeum acidophilus ARMAN-5]
MLPGSGEILAIKKGYIEVLRENKLQYVMNPDISGYKKLSRSVYSVVKGAFKLYKKGIVESVYIVAGIQDNAEKIKVIKKEMEDRYHYIGTDSGFYETPFLGKMQDFSVNCVSIVTNLV